MIDSEGGAFGFDCYLASPEFRVFQQPAKAQGRRALLQIALGLLSELALREVSDLRGRAVHRPFAMSALQRHGFTIGLCPSLA